MYYRRFYHTFSQQQIAKSIRDEGFDPILISNEAGYEYPLHQHAETKLLAFLKGSMQVRVADKVFECGVSDKLLIEGNIPHAAKVGPEGCMFFWSEKLL